MNIYLDPTYFLSSNKVKHETWAPLLCPICDAPSDSPCTTYVVVEHIQFLFTCRNNHRWWLMVGKDVDGGPNGLGVSVHLNPSIETENLMRKWQYDPAKRFVNQGGYDPCSVPQQDKILFLAKDTEALTELVDMMHGVWAYPSMAKWCKNDAGFVVAWLSGVKGDLP